MTSVTDNEEIKGVTVYKKPGSWYSSVHAACQSRTEGNYMRYEVVMKSWILRYRPSRKGENKYKVGHFVVSFYVKLTWNQLDHSRKAKVKGFEIQKLITYASM